MNLILGPDNLSIDFDFSFAEANKKLQKKYNNIGLYFSGGIDSTALLLVIINELIKTEKIEQFPIRCFTIKKKDFATDNSTKVLEKVKNKFNIDIEHINHIPNYKNLEHDLGIPLLTQLYLENINTLFFTGINKTPSEDIVKFKNKLNLNYGYWKDRGLYYSPFLYMNKAQILDIFYKFNCIDILEQTYSCTSHPTMPCGDCYSCEERAWGFEMLHKIDPLLPKIDLQQTDIRI